MTKGTARQLAVAKKRMVWFTSRYGNSSFWHLGQSCETFYKNHGIGLASPFYFRGRCGGSGADPGISLNVNVPPPEDVMLWDGRLVKRVPCPNCLKLASRDNYRSAWLKWRGWLWD